MDPKQKPAPDVTAPDLEPVEPSAPGVPGPADSLVPLDPDDDVENTDAARVPDAGPAPSSTILFDDEEEDEVTPSRAPKHKRRKPAAPPPKAAAPPAPSRPKSGTKNVAVLQATSGTGTHARKALKPLKGDAFEGAELPAQESQTDVSQTARRDARSGLFTPANVVLVTLAVAVIAFVVWLLW